MSIAEARKIDITVYLSKDEFNSAQEVLKSDVSYSEVAVNVGDSNLGTLFLMNSKPKLPPWASFFTEIVSREKIGLNQSTGALFIVEELGHLFLITFGQGRHLIRPECIETNFGLRAALNILEPESIRSLDKSSLEALPKQAREQSGEAVGLQFFGVDIESDLLRAITGIPQDETFGNRVSGGDPIKISVALKLEGIKGLLRKIWKAYIDESYKDGPFSWIDHIGEVKDKNAITCLDNALIEQLRQQNYDRIWLCAPGIIDWEKVVGFKYSNGQRAFRYHDTRIEECLTEVVRDTIDINLLKRRKILAIDSNEYPIFEDTVYRFIYAEIWRDGIAHILNAGKWYVVNAEYVERIQEKYNAICAKIYKRTLLEYDDETEALYNKRVADSNPNEYMLLDSNNILLADSASPVEPCDIYRHEKELIHVKRYGGSSILSHLFNQGLVSGELLQSEIQFRIKFNEKLEDHLKINGIEKVPKRNEYTIVYAIISEQAEGLSIPFFSKISLKHAVNRLEAFGFKVFLAKIPVSETRRKTKKCPPK